MRRTILTAVAILLMCALLGLSWVRPIVRWPLLLLSGASLFVLAATLVIPYPVPVRNQLLMATVGTGALALTYVYDAVLGFLAGCGEGIRGVQ
ncbi:hypothetical protein F4827_005286 [Paraburkholderia bannensis]|uniref:Uncharacterized protein n=1 Tax=Paraburkholderia bannensis TaxID=765414 RepID=A0A7W9WV81_9BURK|nr:MULTISPECIES: hypothetical protein [Paraburkholderia]MBB3260383.1 hypothetical protein [Paraburkholderia sp. WP4_3_2]MBB6105419.1 hypothetical protein [Paraburkholderia bannensis]